jgi:hypothetical protein
MINRIKWLTVGQIGYCIIINAINFFFQNSMNFLGQHETVKW